MSVFFEELVSKAKELNTNITRIAAMESGSQPECVDLAPAAICMNSYSVAKLFTAAAIGVCCDEGLLNTSERIVDILHDYLPDKYDERFDIMTVDMALRHYCGFKSGYLDIDVADLNPVTSGDYLKYLFKTRLENAPGAVYCYSDAAFYLLSRVVTQKTGCALDDFLWQKLLYPMGFRELAFSHCPKGYAIGATGLYINTLDMVKLPMLYIDKGMWQGKRLLSEDWIKKSLERGYALTVTEHSAFHKGGMYGQLVLALPDQKRAVAWHSVKSADTKELIKWAINYK